MSKPISRRALQAGAAAGAGIALTALNDLDQLPRADRVLRPGLVDLPDTGDLRWFQAARSQAFLVRVRI